MTDRHTEAHAIPSVTKRQRQAMRAFLWSWGREGYDDSTCDGACWDQGVRPWPTMDNLCTKGLIVRDEWFGSEEGWTYKLTDLGRDFMRALVAEIGAPAGRTLR